MSLITQNNFCTTHTASIRSKDGNDSGDNQKVVRRFINSAVYVEKLLPDMHTIDHNSYNGFNVERKSSLGKIKKTLKCSCANNYSKCPCHPNNNLNYEYNEPLTNRSDSTASEISSFAGSQVTIKHNNLFQDSELRLSLTSLTSQRTFIDNAEKEEILKNWLAKKEKEKKQRLLKEQKEKEEKQKRRDEILEKERENFRRWLTDKKKEEILKKAETEKRLDEERQREEEKEKRLMENELTYKLWLQRKKKDELEKKIRYKIKEIEIMEERERKTEDNKIAFQEWVKNSKTKPKPLPLNQGLTSLCSSLSVTYINPVPWTPNIDDEN